TYRETVADLYSEWYANHNDYKKAYEYHKKFKKISDTLNTQDGKEEIALMETRFRVEGKNNEIKMLQDEKKIQQLYLKQKNTYNYIFAGSTVALLVISLISYRNYRQKQ